MAVTARDQYRWARRFGYPRWQSALKAMRVWSLLAVLAALAGVLLFPGVAAAQADLAQGRPTSASSSYAGLPPNLAVDNNSSTRWSSNFTNAQWWRVDLGSTKTIGKVELNWEAAYASQYRIQTSLTGKNNSFSDVATVNITSAGLKTTTFTPRSARYVRVLGVTRATQYGISFWDARVFAPDPPPPPPPPPTGMQRLRAQGGNLVNEVGEIQPTMRGFNVHVVPWNQDHFTEIAARGGKVLRHVIHWDTVEPTPGNVDTAWFAALDAQLNRAEAAGLYSILELHLNVGRTPAWTTATNTEMEDYGTYGQFITQYLASRYGARKSVLGFGLNEPPLEDGTIRNGNSSIPYLEAKQRQMISWMRVGAPEWIGFVAMGYAMATPIYADWQNGAAIDASPTAYSSVGGNVVVDAHDYMVGDTRQTPPYDGRQWNGMIYPDYQGGPMITSAAGGYTASALRRAQFAAYWQPYVTYKQQSGYPLMLGEWSWHEPLATAGEVAFTDDKQTAWATAAPALELWWNYDVTTDRGINPFAARPGGTWRPSVLDWLAG